MALLKFPLVFRGIIIKWNGLTSNIPKGYQICDGTNGTPDLRARFSKGVATNTTNPGTIGGSDTVTLTTAQLPSHNHSITETAHSHTDTTSFCGCFSSLVSAHNKSWPNACFTQTCPANLSGVSVGNTGCGMAHENRPAFYQVIFIMKTSDW